MNLFLGPDSVAQPDFGYEVCNYDDDRNRRQSCYWVRGIADALNAKERKQFEAIRDVLDDRRRFNHFRRDLVPFLQFTSRHPEARCTDAFRSTIPELVCQFGQEPNQQKRYFRNLISLDVNNGPDGQVITPIEIMNEELRAMREREESRYSFLQQLQGDGRGNRIEPTRTVDGYALPQMGLTGGSEISQEGGGSGGSSAVTIGRGGSSGTASQTQSSNNFTRGPASQNTQSGAGFGKEHQITPRSVVPTPQSAYIQSFAGGQSRVRTAGRADELVFARGAVQIQREVANEAQPIDSKLNFTPNTLPEKKSSN